VIPNPFNPDYIPEETEEDIQAEQELLDEIGDGEPYRIGGDE